MQKAPAHVQKSCDYCKETWSRVKGNWLFHRDGVCIRGKAASCFLSLQHTGDLNPEITADTDTVKGSFARTEISVFIDFPKSCLFYLIFVLFILC